jgi:methylmalonyl-CoA/ethylmalonyl-CoA epimerase
MKIDHICFAVNDLGIAVDYWKDIFGYLQMTEQVINTRQKVKVVFLTKKDSLTVKLIEPLEENESLKNFVKIGGGFHHLCFKCENLPDKISELQNKGVRMLVPPQPGEAFENNDIAFFWAKNRIHFELIETEKKSKILNTG